jgi:hypothetical protein
MLCYGMLRLGRLTWGPVSDVIGSGRTSHDRTWHAMLCYALCYAMLCYAVLWRTSHDRAWHSVANAMLCCVPNLSGVSQRCTMMHDASHVVTGTLAIFGLSIPALLLCTKASASHSVA